MPHHRQVPDPGHSGHALRNEEPKGVRTTSFRDFLQNGYTWPRLRAGESSGVGQAGGHPSGLMFPAPRRALPHAPEKGVRLHSPGLVKIMACRARPVPQDLARGSRSASSEWEDCQHGHCSRKLDEAEITHTVGGRGPQTVRHDLPADAPVAPGNQHRGSFVAKATEVATDQLLLNKAVIEFNRGFWAKGTLTVKKVRRGEVMRLAHVVTG